MTNFKQQFFLQYASLGLAELITQYRAHYEPKKGDRFNVEGITYEIGPAKMTAKGIEFEISSKIPQEELPKKADMVKYFEAVKKMMRQAEKAPLSIDMENIIREISEEETKERDYVKLLYSYAEEELCGDKAVRAELKRLQQDPSKGEVPPVPGVNTLAGRVVLSLLKRNIQQGAKVAMDGLIKANTSTRKKMRTTVERAS